MPPAFPFGLPFFPDVIEVTLAMIALSQRYPCWDELAREAQDALIEREMLRKAGMAPSRH